MGLRVYSDLHRLHHTCYTNRGQAAEKLLTDELIPPPVHDLQLPPNIFEIVETFLAG
jgi:hypothetical protein